MTVAYFTKCTSLIVGLSMTACLLVRTDRTECQSNTECRDAFGFGSTCASDGFCARAEPNARCVQTFPTDLLERPEAYKDWIIFGSVMDRSVDLFVKFEKSVQLALSQANDENGVLNREFGMVFCQADVGDGVDFGDSFEDTPTAAAAMAQYLVDSYDVPAIFGAARSSETQAMFEEVRDDNVLVISPSATSPSLTALDPEAASDDAPGLLWRTAPSDAFQGSAIASDMNTAGNGRVNPVDNVAIIYRDDAYGNGLTARFSEDFNGVTTPYPFDTDGKRDSFVSMVGLDPDVDEVLFLSSVFDDVVVFLNQSTSITGYDTKGIFLTEAAASNDIINDSDINRLTQVRATRPKPLNRELDVVYCTFLGSYFGAYSEDAEDQVYTANSYDAGWILIYGAAWAMYQEGQNLTGTTIARGLRRLSSGPSLDVGPTTWTTVKQQFESGNSINITGASGSLDYSTSTEEIEADIEIFTIAADRSITPLYTWTPSQ